MDLFSESWGSFASTNSLFQVRLEDPLAQGGPRYFHLFCVAYLHLVEADWDDALQFTEEFRQAIRARFKRPIIVAGNYDQTRAEWVLSKGYADLVAFGRPFAANPDFPHRLANGVLLAQFDGNTLFGGDERGYVDYATASEAAEVLSKDACLHRTHDTSCYT